MEYRLLLSVSVICILFQCAHSLKCYTCNSKEPDQTCASPLDTEKLAPQECNKTTLYSDSPFGSETDFKLKAAGNTSDFQCIFYEKVSFESNKTQSIRRCMQKIENFCTLLNDTAQEEQSHHLKKCHICTTDNCNSSTNLHISAFLCVFGLLLGSTFNF